MLPSLADKCSAYLQENLDASIVFTVLPDVQKYEEKDLLDHCWKVIEKETEEAVKSDDFVTIERSVLEEMVKKETLNIKELELFKAVDRWAEKECETARPCSRRLCEKKNPWRTAREGNSFSCDGRKRVCQCCTNQSVTYLVRKKYAT